VPTPLRILDFAGAKTDQLGKTAPVLMPGQVGAKGGPNQALIVQIERVGAREAAEESALAWLAANAVENDNLPTDLADQHDHYLYGSPRKDKQR